MAEGATERLFFALWPDAAVRAALERAGREAFVGSGRLVPAARLHMTLAFLGDVSGGTRDCLMEACNHLHLPPFDLRLDGIGWWRRSQVLWAGCDPVPAPLGALVAAIHGAMTHCGLEPESRPFAAHVTLARKVRRGGRAALTAPILWPVDRFALVRSDPEREGVTYTTLASWPLDGA